MRILPLLLALFFLGCQTPFAQHYYDSVEVTTFYSNSGSSVLATEERWPGEFLTSTLSSSGHGGGIAVKAIFKYDRKRDRKAPACKHDH